MKQTATEFLFEQVVNLDWKNLQGEEKMKIFKKAKELEKQKIIQFADKYDAYVVQGGTLTAEQYYNETFNK